MIDQLKKNKQPCSAESEKKETWNAFFEHIFERQMLMYR